MSAELEQSQPEVQPEQPVEGVPAEALLTPAPSITDEDLKKNLECLLFITDRPLPARELAKACGLSVKEASRVARLCGEIRAELETRGAPYQAIEVADGWRMSTRTEYAGSVRKIFSERLTLKLSTAAHETLAIVAYKQPITRAEIEEVWGVEVIAALETLLEKRLLRVVGRKETVGRPLMYGTTVEFLRHFGLRSLEDLPPLDSFAAQDPSMPSPDPVGEAVVPTPESLALSANSSAQDNGSNTIDSPEPVEDPSSGQ